MMSKRFCPSHKKANQPDGFFAICFAVYTTLPQKNPLRASAICDIISMKKAHSFVLPIILYVFPLMDIFACSCFSEEKTMSEVVVSQVAVFSGVILSNESIEGKWGDAYYKSKVRLTKVWKLEGNEKVVTIRTATEISSCGGPPPKVGEEYIVFSHAVVNGIHSTGGCSYFSSIENKNETVLEFIQELGPPKRMYEK